MSRNLNTYFCILLTLFFIACDKEHLPEGESGSGSGRSSISDDLPKLSVAEAQMQADDSRIVVTGYVVGYIESTRLSGAVFGVPEESENANIIIADDPAETDISKVFPVKLETSSSIRAALNLFAYPENLHRRISIEGKVENYFSVKGIKKVYGFVWESDVPVPDPDDDGHGTEPQPNPEPDVEPDPSVPTPGISDTPTDIPEGR